MLNQDKWQLAGPRLVAPPMRLRPLTQTAETPVSQQVLTWMLFWPLLTLVARQAVFLSGPARSAEAYQDVSATAARGPHQYLYVNLFLLFSFAALGYREIWAVLKKNPLLPTLLGLAVCSAMWSLSADTTLRMCLQMGLCTFFACYLATRFTTERLMELLIFMGVASALLSIFFALALPSYGIFQGYGHNAWQGISNHKNSLGISMVYLLTPVFFTQSYSRSRRFAYAGLILFIIAMTQSRGAWVDTAGVLGFVAWLHFLRRVRTHELRLILVLSLAILIVTALGILEFWPMIAASMGKDASMTGRTGIYIEVFRSILKKPFIGYGMGGFWYPGSLESKRIGLVLGWPNIGYSENGFLEVALQLGFLGVGLLLAFLGRGALQGIQLVRSFHYTPRVGWFLTILCLCGLSNIEGGWFLTAETLDWVLIVVACVGLNEERLRISRYPLARRA